MEPSVIQVGTAVGVIMALIELVKYVIGKYTAQNNKTDRTEEQMHEKMCGQLELMNTNHLNHIEGAINTGNERIVSAIQAMHIDLIKELSRK